MFGFFSRRLPFGWILLSFVFLKAFSEFSGGSWAVTTAQGIQAAFFVLACLVYLSMPKYHQAAVGWWITKASLALVSFVVLLLGGFVGFLRGQPDAAHLSLLALIWFPSLEFVPSLTERQRFITIGRLLLSGPIAYLGAQTGNWKW